MRPLYHDLSVDALHSADSVVAQTASHADHLCGVVYGKDVIINHMSEGLQSLYYEPGSYGCVDPLGPKVLDRAFTAMRRHSMRSWLCGTTIEVQVANWMHVGVSVSIIPTLTQPPLLCNFHVAGSADSIISNGGIVQLVGPNTVSDPFFLGCQFGRRRRQFFWVVCVQTEMPWLRSMGLSPLSLRVRMTADFVFRTRIDVPIAVAPQAVRSVMSSLEINGKKFDLYSGGCLACGGPATGITCWHLQCVMAKLCPVCHDAFHRDRDDGTVATCYASVISVIVGSQSSVKNFSVVQLPTLVSGQSNELSSPAIDQKVVLLTSEFARPLRSADQVVDLASCLDTEDESHVDVVDYKSNEELDVGVWRPVKSTSPSQTFSAEVSVGAWKPVASVRKARNKKKVKKFSIEDAIKMSHAESDAVNMGLLRCVAPPIIPNF